MNITEIDKYKNLNMTEHKIHMNITKIKKYKQLNSTSTAEHKTDINITELEKYKKLNMTEHKAGKILNEEHLKNLNKIKKYRKLDKTEQKTDMNITKTDKYKKNPIKQNNNNNNNKLNSTSMMKHRTDMDITEIDKNKKLNMTEHKIQLQFGEPNNKHIQIQQRSNRPQNSSRKKVNENIQSTTEQYAFFVPVTKKSEEFKTI